MNPRWTVRPEGSNWGEFGPDDTRGRMNYVTRDKVLQGVAEVKAGRSFCLSLPLDYPGGNVLNPRRNPPRLAPTIRACKANFCYPFADENPALTDVVCDDVVLLTLQYSSQWDSFAHVGGKFDADGDGKPEIVFYNGFRPGDGFELAGEKAGAEPWARFEGARADATLDGIHDVALREIVRGLVDLGVIKATFDEALEKQLYKPYFMHKTSHFLGMDVHDVGAYFVAGKPRPRSRAALPPLSGAR